MELQQLALNVGPRAIPFRLTVIAHRSWSSANVALGQTLGFPFRPRCEIGRGFNSERLGHTFSWGARRIISLAPGRPATEDPSSGRVTQPMSRPSHRSHPERQRGPSSGGGRGAGRCGPRGRRSAPARLLRPMRRTTDRSSRWPARRAASRTRPSRWSTAPSLRSICARTGARIPAWARSTCCRSSRSGMRRWLNASSLPVEWGPRSRSASGCPSFCTKPLSRARRGGGSRTSGADSSKGWRSKMADPEWTPDFGPSTPHPTAGAVAIGARRPLIAFNVNLKSDRVDIARLHRPRRARAIGRTRLASRRSECCCTSAASRRCR